MNPANYDSFLVVILSFFLSNNETSYLNQKPNEWLIYNTESKNPK